HFVLLGDETHPPYFIKYHQSCLEYESQTLEYLYGLASNDPDAPRIPKLVAYFEDSCFRGYLVMEYISSPVVSLDTWIEAGESDDDKCDRVDIAVAKVAKAIDWLRSCPLPANASVGSVGGGPIYHRF
ncbi:hypothetical protein H0H92_013782, partial [Tricholoma furcatifolium]